MPEDIDVASLVGRPESPSTLLRFEDEADQHSPRLKYSVPLPGSYECRAYLQVQLPSIPWNQAALSGDARLPEITGGGATLGERVRQDPGLLYRAFNYDPRIIDPPPRPKPVMMRLLASPSVPRSEEADKQAPLGGLQLLERANQMYVGIQDHEIAVAEIERAAILGRVPVIYRTAAGTVRHTYVHEARDEQGANPRFVIVERYRLASYFGDYGAGRTIKTFTLWPGEETVLYVRSWRRTEQRLKDASTIFDSYTREASDDFEASLEAESSNRESYEETKQWKAEGGFGLDLGIFSIGGGGGGGGSSKSAREQLAKTVASVATHHASKASANRDITVSTELEASESTEFETITERRLRNVNLSRVLNLVCRELNQEFVTYLSLHDVSVAFVNDRHVYDEVPIYDIDRLLGKYLNEAWDGNPPAGRADPRTYVKTFLLDQMSTVVDFQGERKQLLERADDLFGGNYYRVRRRTDPTANNPFYEDGSVPVDGIVISASRHTVRTDGVIIDALLGHGVALDTYALGTQQEVLREKRLANAKVETALELLRSSDADRIKAFRQLFVSDTEEIVERLVRGFLNRTLTAAPEADRGAST
jgi:hypothetical protein